MPLKQYLAESSALMRLPIPPLQHRTQYCI